MFCTSTSLKRVLLRRSVYPRPAADRTASRNLWSNSVIRRGHGRLAQPVTTSPKTGRPFRKTSTSFGRFEKPSHHPDLWLRYDPSERPEVAYFFLFQIFAYLGRPDLSDEAASQFLTAFDSAPVPPTSDIGRVRMCHSLYTSIIIHHLSSIPYDSPLRKSHPKMFDIVKSLLPLRDRFLAHRVQEGKALGWEVTGEQVQEWCEFCFLTMPLLEELMKELELGGFGGPDGMLDDGEGKDPEVLAERQTT